MSFLTNSDFILQIYHAKAFKKGILGIFYPKILIKMLEDTFHVLLEIDKIGKISESTKSYFPVFL